MMTEKLEENLQQSLSGNIFKFFLPSFWAPFPAAQKKFRIRFFSSYYSTKNLFVKMANWIRIRRSWIRINDFSL